MTRHWIGTSGYSHPQWKGRFYPDDLADEEMLRHYAGRLNAEEINQTFQRAATVRQLQGLARDVGDGFTFALKAPRRVTHELRLRDAADVAGDFCATAAALGEKLGALLFQLPPYLKRDVARLEDFLHQLPPEVRVVFEFRNPTWYADETVECLRRFATTWCVTDREDLEVPIEPTANFGYFRMRRAEYGDAALRALAAHIAAAGSSWDDVFVFFKHETEAPVYAAALREVLAAPAR
jgi:uncharacterized protein YecE (DUF72 family)